MNRYQNWMKGAMRPLLAGTVLALLSFNAVADEHSSAAETPPAANSRGVTIVVDELDRVFGDFGPRELSTLTFAEVEAIAARLSIAQQQAAYIRRARVASYLMPGLGHFFVDEVGSGIAFLLTDVAVTVGSLLGGYALLPVSVQQQTATGTTGIDYLTDDFAAIKTAWEGLSIYQLLPSLGVVTAGAILRAVIGVLAAGDAAALAEAAVAEGRVHFEPRPFAVIGRGLSLGVELGYR